MSLWWTKWAIGDFVLVHAGFALHRWDYEDVVEWRALMQQMLADEEPLGEEHGAQEPR